MIINYRFCKGIGNKFVSYSCDSIEGKKEADKIIKKIAELIKKADTEKIKGIEIKIDIAGGMVEPYNIKTE